jgi:hypothetical protein
MVESMFCVQSTRAWRVTADVVSSADFVPWGSASIRSGTFGSVAYVRCRVDTQSRDANPRSGEDPRHCSPL